MSKARTAFEEAREIASIVYDQPEVDVHQTMYEGLIELTKMLERLQRDVEEIKRRD